MIKKRRKIISDELKKHVTSVKKIKSEDPFVSREKYIAAGKKIASEDTSEEFKKFDEILNDIEILINEKKISPELACSNLLTCAATVANIMAFTRISKKIFLKEAKRVWNSNIKMKKDVEREIRKIRSKDE